MPTTTSAQVWQLTNGDPDGTSFGQSTSDLITFYNGTPVVQPSGNAQAAATQGSQCGVIATLALSASPAAVANNTSSEKGLTIAATTAAFQIASGDLLYVNKPTSQAGLGVGNVRVSATNVAGVTFTNFTAATITPTTTETYGFVAIRGFTTLTATLSPAAVQPNTTVEQTFTVTGIRAGDVIQVNKPTSQAGIDIVGVRAVSNNTVGITFTNVTAATVTPTASESYSFVSLGGVDSTNNTITIESVQSPAAVANATATEVGLTVTGLATTDTIVGVSKPTAQAGIGLVGWRVSAANTLGLTFMNATAATVTPTASESYKVSVFRPKPVAPMVKYSQTLTPVSVAANTTAEQTFTVTGLVAGSPVWVNKPSPQNGLGIAGVRVSAANTLAITFSNSSSSAITPTSETYLIANFQIPIPDDKGAWIQSAPTVTQQTRVLANGIRTALTPSTGLNLIAGA